MGSMGDSIAAYAQPLMDRTDGSCEQAEKAMTIAMLCWNVAILPDAEHEEWLADMRKAFNGPDEEFAAFRRDVIEPMIRRHREMFPMMNPARRQMLRNVER